MTSPLTFSLDIGWRPLLKDLGIAPEHVLRRAGLPDDLLSRRERGLTTDEYFRFWQALEQCADDARFPLPLIERVSADVFDPALFAALCSANLMQAVQRLAKYKRLVAPMHLSLAVDAAGTLTVAPHWLAAPTTLPASLLVAEVAFFLRLARLATRAPVQAQRVTLPQLPTAAASRDYTRFFGVAVEQADTPSISFTAADALRPFLTVNDGMWRAFEPELRRRLSTLEANATTAERVRAVLLELLPGNAATLEAAAERLGLSPRTLQRRLASEGQPFRALLNHSRERLARHYLSQTRLSSAEIAFLLGFEDPNSFYRAFQSWTGQTPDAVRQTRQIH